jgi:hypothetical protein
MVRFGVSNLTGGIFLQYQRISEDWTLVGDCLQVVVLGLVDNVRTFYNSCPELHGEDVLWQNFGTTFRKNSKSALQCYECQGIEHFAKKCPKRQRRQAKMKNSPGKENPNVLLKSQGVRLNTGF